MTKRPASVRPPAVAGRFYPQHPAQLRRMVEDFLRQAGAAAGPAPKAIIAPHAGYIYSGPVAGSAYARLASSRETIRRVVLIGPSHYVSFAGLAATSAESFSTPLGVVPVDTAAVQDLCARLPQVVWRDDAHANEHSLEVQLPFLQVVLADFQLVPLLVGATGDQEVAAVLDMLWGGDETRFIISSDLSHYHDSDAARELDAATAGAIEDLRADALGENQACGCWPIRGLLRAAQGHSLKARTLDLRNSGDTAGPRHRVVGYGAFAFESAADRTART